jgi:hypothetical protein
MHLAATRCEQQVLQRQVRLYNLIKHFLIAAVKQSLVTMTNNDVCRLLTAHFLLNVRLQYVLRDCSLCYRRNWFRNGQLQSSLKL